MYNTRIAGFLCSNAITRLALTLKHVPSLLSRKRRCCTKGIFERVYNQQSMVCAGSVVGRLVAVAVLAAGSIGQSRAQEQVIPRKRRYVRAFSQCAYFRVECIGYVCCLAFQQGSGPVTPSTTAPGMRRAVAEHTIGSASMPPSEERFRSSNLLGSHVFFI
jgi:hypothetical protein